MTTWQEQAQFPAKQGFETMYSGKGIGGYIPTDPTTEHVAAFDGNSSGARDHLLFYRAGSGTCSVIKRTPQGFVSIYASDQGIGGWDFSSTVDRVFAFDYTHSGKMDHLVCFRPGGCAVFILAHDGNGNFAPVFANTAVAPDAPSSTPRGIGGWALTYPWDRMIAFDLDHSGKTDALFGYRRRNGCFWAVRNINGQFVDAAHEWCWGFGGYRTQSTSNYAFAYDWTHSGRDDHILWIDAQYSTAPPGVITTQGDKWITVWRGASPEGGIAGFPKPKGPINYGGEYGGEVFKSFGFIFDFSSSGRNDCFGCFDATSGTIWFMTPEQDGATKWTISHKSNQGIGEWNVHGGIFDRTIAFDYDGSGCMDHLLAFRRQSGEVWVLRKAGHQPKPPIPVPPRWLPAWPPQIIPQLEKPNFTTVFKVLHGLPGFDLAPLHTRAFILDYDHSGKQDHLCFYSAPKGTFWIGKNNGQGSLAQVIQTEGCGGYDLKSPADRAFAFDFEHSGKLDYVCFYRPGTGKFVVLQNSNGNFTQVYPAPGQAHQGIANFPMAHADDRAFAFDYDHSGCRDYIVCHAPQTGRLCILQNVNGVFSIVFDGGPNGPGGFPLGKTNPDRIFAYDYDHSGKLDHIICMRPLGRVGCILKNEGGKFSQVYFKDTKQLHDNLPWMFATIGGWDLEVAADHAFPFDFNGSGSMDHICFYRPGHGMFFVVRNLMGTFAPIYQGFANGLGPYAKKTIGVHQWPLYYVDGKGIGDFGLMGAHDHCLPFDFTSSGRCDHIAVFRPEQGLFMIVQPINRPPTSPQTADQGQAWGAWGQTTTQGQ